MVPVSVASLRVVVKLFDMQINLYTVMVTNHSRVELIGMCIHNTLHVGDALQNSTVRYLRPVQI